MSSLSTISTPSPSIDVQHLTTEIVDAYSLGSSCLEQLSSLINAAHEIAAIAEDRPGSDSSSRLWIICELLKTTQLLFADFDELLECTGNTWESKLAALKEGK